MLPLMAGMPFVAASLAVIQVESYVSSVMFLKPLDVASHAACSRSVIGPESVEIAALGRGGLRRGCWGGCGASSSVGEEEGRADRDHYEQACSGKE